MIPRAELQALEELVAGIDTPGVRVVCAFCQADLPGSDPGGHCVRYGLCSPPCAPAVAPESFSPVPPKIASASTDYRRSSFS